jgi:hypothetical protein
VQCDRSLVGKSSKLGTIGQRSLMLELASLTPGPEARKHGWADDT